MNRLCSAGLIGFHTMAWRTIGLLLAALLAPHSVANEDSGILWALDGKIAEQTKARYLAQPKAPQLMDLALETEIQFKDNWVHFRRKVVSYFPRFIDAENHGSFSVFFNPNIEALRILSAASISADGEIKQIEPNQLQILPVGDYNTFSSAIEVVLALPGVAEGSLTVVEFEKITARDKMESDWSYEMYVAGNVPVQDFSFDVQWQTPNQVSWASNSDLVECQAEVTRLSCQGSNIAPFKNDPQIYWHDHAGKISLGTLASWSEVTQRTRQLMRQANKEQRGVDALFTELTADAASTEQKIANIAQFVSRDIRYVSRSVYGNAMTPHTLATTLANRYGDCKDKSVLLKALLEKLGLSPELVLVATDRYEASGVLLPTMNVFDHIVVCFDWQGKQYCLDPTDNYTNWQHTPAWIQNQFALPLQSAQSPTRIHPNRYRWRMDIDTQLVFDEQGGQREVQTRTMFGEYAAHYREALYEQTPADRVSYLQQMYQSLTDAEPEMTVTYAHIDDLAEQLVVTTDAQFEPFGSLDESWYYTEMDVWLIDELSQMRLENQHYGQYTSGGQVNSVYLIDLNGVWQVDNYPAKIDFQHPFGRLTRDVERISATQYRVSTSFDVPAQYIEVDDIERFNRLLLRFQEHLVISSVVSPIEL